MNELDKSYMQLLKLTLRKCMDGVLFVKDDVENEWFEIRFCPIIESKLKKCIIVRQSCLVTREMNEFNHGSFQVYWVYGWSRRWLHW